MALSPIFCERRSCGRRYQNCGDLPLCELKCSYRSLRSFNMEKKHTYRVTAWWSSERTGLAKSDAAPNAIHFSAPPQFGGMEGRWSPEDLLLSAVASCFTTTFKA